VAHLPDPTCRGKAWVSPITALDVWSGIYDFNRIEGASHLKQAIATATPPAAGAIKPAAALPAATSVNAGSNAYALGRDATRGHGGMLLANPHFPWSGYARWYQVQLTIPGVLNVSGASVGGTPVVELGHTDGVAWTHTVSHAQRATLYQLHLVRGDPTSYLVDGRAEKMTRQRVTVTVRGSGGELSTLTRTLCSRVANSNDSPLLTNPKAQITGYPRVFDTRTEPELRPRLSHDMISQRLAGTDGLGQPGFTLATLQAATLGDRDYSAELGRTDVVGMCHAHPVLTATNGKKIDVRAACATLAAWDAHANTGSRGAVLWREFFAQPTRTPAWWKVAFDPAHPLTTPRGINGNDPGVKHALADTVQSFQTNHTPLDITLGSAQRYAGVPLHGCPDDEGCFNVVQQSGPPSSNGYADVNQGSSFIMAAEMAPTGPRTRTILTYSESANPTSPHYTDQTVLFSHKQWVTERFTEAEINADPHLQTTTLHG
jgi:acyl-homoserine lactone acylase PvdQ